MRWVIYERADALKKISVCVDTQQIVAYHGYDDESTVLCLEGGHQIPVKASMEQIADAITKGAYT